ncbi:MAG: 4-hydroxythreonine-4-phosphate dehydrogenase PdxA [Candidatus Aminicenantes bacterium]|nr:MAG: 4-hydroxythreonine-4-phosphate dehydrogenase PdxA [Candidatus Aminicenantes bacterium]
MTRPKIGITLGDPGGIGPEVTLKSLSSFSSLPDAHFVLFGSQRVIDYERAGLNLDLSLPRDSISFHEVEGLNDPVIRGKPTPPNGTASFRYFEQAVQQAQKGNIQALVTGPVSKQSWDLAGIPWAGHTEYLSRFYPEAIMFFWSDDLKVALYTHHIPLQQAIARVKEKPLFEFFMRLDENLNSILSPGFEFLVSGMNPHAGENGLLGSEEKEDILPSIERARSKGIQIHGPFPPDVVFRHVLNKPDKIAIAMYHDQGLIPFKLLAFDRGVNLTLGLPFIRTSPDHGTAFDIAGKGTADPRSMIEAIRLAHRLISARELDKRMR